MAYFSDEDLFEEMMDPCQFMFWDKEDRPYHLMGSYDDDDSDSDGISGVLLQEMLRLNSTRSKNRLCKFYQRGNCRYGNRCRFQHKYEGSVNENCIFFERGYCRNGQTCKFKHANFEPVAVSRPHQAQDTEVQDKTQSPFYPTDDDLKAGRLTRLKFCLDIPIKDSVCNPKPQHHGSYHVELFVNKREDDVKYLYDALIAKAKHPLYQTGMFDLCKPGTSCDLSNSSTKLKDTSLLILGNCTEVLLRQSFKHASLLNEAHSDGVTIKEDERRYLPSKLPRNKDGSFEEANLRSLIKVRNMPDDDELFPKDSQCIMVEEREFESCEEAARHVRLPDKYSKYITIHDEVTCKWCTEQGCKCLDKSVDVFDSDDSDFSTDSRSSGSDMAKSHASKSTSARYNCGMFPDEITLSSFCRFLQKNGISSLSFGDLVTFGESPVAGTYVLGKHGKLYKANGSDFIAIPTQITMFLKDAAKKYEKVLQQKPGKTNRVMEIYLRHDDEIMKSAFGKELPSAWRYCMVARYGTGITKLSCDAVQYVRVEFNENCSIEVVAPGHKLPKESLPYVDDLDEMVQKYQSTKESANFTSFEIEMALNDNDQEALISKHGMLAPRIPSWFITSQNCQNIKDRQLKFVGPHEEVEIIKAIVEEFYEGCNWRYSRMDADLQK